MASFFQELRRRNVLRLAATYALAAWIVIEAGSVLLPTFGAPDWVFRAYVITILLGFVASLILAWVFEVTPEGVRLEQDLDHDRPQTRKKQRSNRIIIALLAIALAVSVTFNVSGIRNGESGPTAGAAPDYHTIAVLPFSSRSTNPENRYFADGMHDDLLARLADIDALRVISRTSVNEYRDTSKNVRDIGAELGADGIVEGSVQRSGNQVRITVRLVDAASDEQLWTGTYDEIMSIDNVFKIQSDISSQIATALRTVLTPEEELRLATISTNSIEALSKYSAGRNNLSLRRFETLLEARKQFEDAVALDPNYAQAWAGLAETAVVTFTNHQAIPHDVAFEIAEDAVQKALSIDDQLAEAWAVKGLLEYERWKIDRVDDGDVRAVEAFETALALNPNLASAYVWFASLRESEDRSEDAIDLLHRAISVDPLGRIPYINLPLNYSRLGQNDQAIELLLKSMQIFPDWASPYSSMTDHMMGLGRLDEAVAWTTIAESMTEDPMITRNAIGAYLEFGDFDRIQAFLDKFPPQHPMHAIGAGYGHFSNHEYEAAIDVLSSAELPAELEFGITFPLISRAAIASGRYETAREYLLRANPLLASDTNMRVDRHNLRAATLLAFALRQTGEERQAADLLAEAWDVAQQMPRVGLAGHGIVDVHILAIQGRNNAALDALQAAIDEGFVSLIPFDYWTLDQDILIDPLRDDPRFEAMRDSLQKKIERMRDNVRRAEELGDWREILNRADADVTAALRL